jgi:hypothetical protein
VELIHDVIHLELISGQDITKHIRKSIDTDMDLYEKVEYIIEFLVACGHPRSGIEMVMKEIWDEE